MPNAEESTTITIRVPLREKVRLHQWAIEHDMTFTDILLNGAKLLAGFNDDFIKIMRTTMEITGRDLPTVISQLLVFYMACDQAIYANLGGMNTLKRAFRFDEKEGLITGEKLHALVYSEEDKAAKEFLAKLEPSAKGKKDVRITNQQAGMIAKKMAAEMANV